MTSWIGIDLGGTKIYAALLEGGKLKDEGKVPTPQEGGPQAIVQAMADLVAGLDGSKRAKGIGVGAPGLIDRKRGILLSAPNLVAWEDNFPMGPALSKLLDKRPVTLGNDVYVGVLGEHRMGAAKKTNDALGIWLGTGVGGGLVLDGQVRRGAHGLAGEIGHTVVNPSRTAPLCACGGRGHVEAYAGRASMERRARALHEKGQTTKLVELAGDLRMKSSVFAAALEAEDPVAVALINEAVDAVGTAIASVHTLLDLELVVLGGGMGDRLGPVIAPRIETVARERGFARAHPIKVVPSALGDASGAAGAALMASTA